MNETKTIRKFFWVWEFDKEEMWLNEMAASGWVLERVGFLTYLFSPCEPGEYALRMEMRAHDDGYVQFLKETGAEYVGRMFAWMYTRKKTADRPFDLFSDMDSRIGHLNRIRKSPVHHRHDQPADRLRQPGQPLPRRHHQSAVRRAAALCPGPHPRQKRGAGEGTPFA